MEESGFVKIIQIMDTLGANGGVNTFVFDLCEALKLNGHDVALVGILSKGMTDNPEIERLRRLNIKIECIGAKSKKDAILHHVGDLRRIIKSIAGEEVTVCNLHLKLGVIMGVLSTIGEKNIRCIETYHNTYHYYHLQCWCCSPFIKKYICVSSEAKREMKRRFFIPDTRTVAIPNGVIREKIRRVSGIDNPREDTAGTCIVSVGRLSYEKNFVTVVRALSSICTDKISYTLVGGGPQESEIRTIAKANSNLKILGAQSRTRTLEELARADIVVMPSLWEGRSILQLEAMALDKPMVISDVPGLREPFAEGALIDGEQFRVCKFGYLVQTNNEEAYRKAIAHFIQNRERKEEISRCVRKISLENDLLEMAERYYNEYEKVVSVFGEEKKNDN